jgi:HD-GYP domain-containing protein (c-di-GMP phosphodiesterase class II)
MSTNRTEKPSDPWTLSQDELRRLLAEKEQEADARLAKEFSLRCQQVRFQETLTERWGKLTDLFELAEDVVSELRRTLGGRDAMLAVVTESQFLEVVGSTSPIPPRYQLDLIEEAFVVGETLAVSGDDADDLRSTGNADFPPGVPQLAVPLFRKDGRPLGVLYVEGAMDPDKTDWLTPFLTLVGVALEDCQHYNQIEQLITDSVLAIATAHEAKVPKQAGHLKRVQDLCKQLCLAMGLTPTQSKRVALLAMIHDMAPDEVIKAFNAIKRGKLTAVEWKSLMAEPFQGGIFPSPLAAFQATVNELRYLRCRWDGKGNDPEVQGEAIPLAARVVAVAEAFEHLTGSRPHRTTMAIPEALAQLARYAGAQYDPAVIEALCHQFATVELEARVSTMWIENLAE